MRHLRLGAAAAALIMAAGYTALPALAQPNGASVTPGASDLTGVVTGRNGPEAGVWVIAETSDLPTKFTRIVVTDDRGRYMMPDLPKANYSVWVRGYGLVDSPRTNATPGKLLNLSAIEAPSTAAAADYYPPIYWFSMLHVPAKKEFPVGHVRSQGAWLSTLKSGGCVACHALGTPGTRNLPKIFSDQFTDPTDAWTRRIQSGGAQGQMARGNRAQCHRHRMGMGPQYGLSARRGLDRSAQSPDQCERQNLWLARRLLRLRADP
jgi:hypothetical protein